ncbi:MAG: hypothetical protein IKN76_03715 [Oscillospiraceae bacterium]|nr:hypothetical protein [Oscillospiraceae bacterium]
MKKIALLLVLILALTLCGCSSRKAAAQPAATAVPVTAASAAAEPEPTAAPTETPEPTPAPTPEPTPSPEPTPTPSPVPGVNTNTSFRTDLLINWTDARFKEVYGVNGYSKFHPADPQPRTYIVCASDVIDPVTGRISEGGYDKTFTRHKPISTEDLLRVSGNLRDGGLVLTDDPDKASFILILRLDYKDTIGTFTFRSGSRINQYHPATYATLCSLVTGETVKTGKLKTFATYANETVRTSMLDAAKGKQLYGMSHTVSASDFPGYWAFIARSERGLPVTGESPVSVVFPAGYFEDLKNSDLAKKAVFAEEREDGTFLLVMTEAQRLSCLETARSDIDAAAAEMEASGAARALVLSPETGEFVFETERPADDQTIGSCGPVFVSLGQACAAYEGEPGREVSVVFKTPGGEILREFNG